MVKIVSDGTSIGTHVYGINNDGEVVAEILCNHVSWEIEKNGRAVAQIQSPSVEIEVIGKVMPTI